MNNYMCNEPVVKSTLVTTLHIDNFHSDTGNRTPVSRVTGGDTSHYTMSDSEYFLPPIPTTTYTNPYNNTHHISWHMIDCLLSYSLLDQFLWLLFRNIINTSFSIFSNHLHISFSFLQTTFQFKVLWGRNHLTSLSWDYGDTVDLLAAL